MTFAEASQPVQLTLSDAACDDSKIQAMTRSLASSLSQEGVSAHLPEGVAEPGSRGDWQEIGKLVLSLAGSGGVIVSLINVLKAYVERRPSLEVELRRPDGATLKLHGNSLSSGDTESLRTEMATFLKEG